MRSLRWALIVLVVGACGGSPGADTQPTDAVPTSSTTSPATTATPAPTTIGPGETTTTTGPTSTSSPGAEVPGVVIADGEVDGPDSVEVTLGEEAAFTATSDIALELHVHGYDLVYEVGPGETVEVRFVADVPGIFEVETHPGHLIVVSLIVER